MDRPRHLDCNFVNWNEIEVDRQKNYMISDAAYRCVDWKRHDMDRPRHFDCHFVNWNEIEGNRLDVDYRCVDWN